MAKPTWTDSCGIEWQLNRCYNQFCNRLTRAHYCCTTCRDSTTDEREVDPVNDDDHHDPLCASRQAKYATRRAGS